MRYLKSTSLGIHFDSGVSLRLMAYSDSTWADDAESRLSTSRILILLHRRTNCCQISEAEISCIIFNGGRDHGDHGSNQGDCISCDVLAETNVNLGTCPDCQSDQVESWLINVCLHR